MSLALFFLACSAGEWCQRLQLQCGQEEDATALPWTDADGDGWSPPADCRDDEALIHPGMEERCDLVDQDCDGEVDDGLDLAQARYTDADLDGWGTGPGRRDCAAPEGPSRGGDCDDSRADVAPGAVERCDGVDQDCDGAVDDHAVDARRWYADRDGDGEVGGSLVRDQLWCADPGWGQEEVEGLRFDCDDLDAAIWSGAEERCDGQDNNCDGQVDEEAEPTPWYRDRDTDGHGAGEAVEWGCRWVGAGWALDDGDCADQDPWISPGAQESCDDYDNNCDGSINEGPHHYVDADGDGYGDPDQPAEGCGTWGGYSSIAGDCDDADPLTYPGAPEPCEEEVDRNCDGRWGTEDQDGDGWPACKDCDDLQADLSPDGEEICDHADQDEDCDGLVDDADPSVDLSTGGEWWPDEDGDGAGALGSSPVQACAAPYRHVGEATDCDDSRAVVYPGAEEVCGDSLDNDCDGVTRACPLLSPWNDAQGAKLEGSRLRPAGRGLCAQQGEESWTIWTGGLRGAAHLSQISREGWTPEWSWSAPRVEPIGVSSEADVPALHLLCGADLNGDGEGDLLSWSQSDNGQVELLLLAGGREAAGQLSWGAEAPLALPWEGAPMALVQLREGLRPELVFSPQLPGQPAVLLLDADLGTAAPLSEAPALLLQPGSNGASLSRAGDLDGDGLDELAVAQPGLARSRLWWVDGVWYASTPVQDLAEPVVGAGEQDLLGQTMVPLGDLDGDGRDELAVGAPGDGRVHPGAGRILLLGWDGAAGLQLVGQVLGASSTDGAGGVFTAGDLDGDGQLDLQLLLRPRGGEEWTWAATVHGPLVGALDLDESEPTNISAQLPLSEQATLLPLDLDLNGELDLLIGASSTDLEEGALLTFLGSGA